MGPTVLQPRRIKSVGTTALVQYDPFIGKPTAVGPGVDVNVLDGRGVAVVNRPSEHQEAAGVHLLHLVEVHLAWEGPRRCSEKKNVHILAVM